VGRRGSELEFGLSVLALPQGSIPSVFQAVERGQADYGVVPVENATEGVVDSTLDTFLDSPLRITAEILLPVEQALLLRHDLEFSQVQRVYSHPQALGQCQRWLASHLPQAHQVAASSTAEAVSGRLITSVTLTRERQASGDRSNASLAVTGLSSTPRPLSGARNDSVKLARRCRPRQHFLFSAVNKFHQTQVCR